LRYLIIALSLFVSLVLESTLLEELKVAGVKPDLLLIFVVFWALFHGKVNGAKMGFIFGLAEDLFVSKFIGLNILCKMTVGYLVGMMERKFFKENFLVPAFTLFFATFVNNFLYMIILQITGVDYAIGAFIWDTTIPTAIYNASLSVLFYGKFYESTTKGYLRPERRR